ncbi:EAL domain-containing protein [Halobacillus kuroshimensis]|uniref:EAL domain-containing protein n=1 Tax=Halobacillus kuroshimensis TaxID=302481 RepID=UPI001FCFDE6D|nr:EAL domain-containing protein [Halobacillus kuroshimensis]
MTGSYNTWFVILSIVAAVAASFASLTMVERLKKASGLTKWKWIAAGALTLGGGIWSMHFVAMLAYDMGMPVRYDSWLLTVSILSSAGASFLAFYLMSRGLKKRIDAAVGSIVIGLGIISMHYIGMEAMIMEAAIRYDAQLVAASAAIAFAASFTALIVLKSFMNYPRRMKRFKIGASLVLGAGISGMHYTGMASASFYHVETSAHTDPFIDPTPLGYIVTFGVFVLIGLFILVNRYDTKMEEHSDHILFMDTLYQTIVESANDAVITMNQEGKILAWNQAAVDTFGFSQKEAVGQLINIVVPPSFYEAHPEGAALFLKKGAARVIGQTVELEGMHATGRVFPLELSLSSTSNDEQTYYTGIIRDISERIQQQERINELVYKDELTHLPNRRMLNDHLETVLMQAHKNNEEAGVLFLDLDRFKQINDVYGHKTGDALLKQVTERLQAESGDHDFAARQSGDEFILVLRETSSYKAGMAASQLLDALREPFFIDEVELFVTPSIGISLYPQDGLEADDLIKFADTAMYQAKQEGGNQYQFFTMEINEVISRKMMLETGLRKAAGRGEIEIYYQPQVVIGTGDVKSFEALVRWNHRELGLVSPLDFIPLAEETKLIIPLGKWILKKACTQFKTWLDEGHELFHISVNISAVQFNDPGFVDSVKQILDETGLDPKYLDLELTESVVQNPQTAIPFMHELKAMGIKISLDDFGTGYSSLNYLKDFPLDTLKIDKSFIQTIHKSSKDRAVVDTIIHMALNLNLNVIAEGVETPSQLDYLISRKCHQYQGYLCSAPVPHDQITTRFFQPVKGAPLT